MAGRFAHQPPAHTKKVLTWKGQGSQDGCQGCFQLSGVSGNAGVPTTERGFVPRREAGRIKREKVLQKGKM